MKRLSPNCEATVPHETLHFDGNQIFRETKAGAFFGTSKMVLPNGTKQVHVNADLRKLWWHLRLRGVIPKVDSNPQRTDVNIVDLCSGCGGLATGVRWACEAVGLRPVFQLCVDALPEANKIYQNNLHPLRVLSENVANLVNYQMIQNATSDARHYQIDTTNQTLDTLKGQVDLVIAGPPCEGHSNFNNRSRRTDVRNELYVAVTACAIALDAKAIVIENVVSVRNSRQRVVPRAIEMLTSAGYKPNIGESVLDASVFGTPQRRRRHFLIASKNHTLDFSKSLKSLTCEPLTAMDALEDLVDFNSSREFDLPSRLSPENDRRVRYLIDNNIWDLPDQERPVCHQDGNHNYKAIYGRIHADQPSQTITTGFLSPGRGRFTHPILPRGLTLHEGARLQGFPDDYKFCGRREDNIPRQRLAHLIGDAVPPQLGYTTGLAALSSF